ncbi:hypothetical protein Mapa_012890 [Marchantia paleacea]|nr:hypothetical protein Mapa_012890 [Marchantia paleacea]
MANLVFPPFPDSRPIARDRCSPRRVLTSLISKDSTYKSSSLKRAIASWISNPRI